jgi:hypothetical protein
MQLSLEAKAGFEEGVGLVFSQWTALCLAVEQEWGGPESEDKANHLIDETIQWFYKKKGTLLKQSAAVGLLPPSPCCWVLAESCSPCCPMPPAASVWLA